MDARPELVLVAVGGQQQLRCTGHDPELPLGEWPLDVRWNPDTNAGILQAIADHKREHPDVWPEAAT